MARKENVHRGDRIEDAVSELLSQLEGLKPARALGLARSRIRKLPPPTDEIYRQLAEAIESRPQALAVLLSMAMSMSISNAAAGGALGRVLEEHAGDGFARLDRSLVEGYFQAMWSMSLGGGGGQRGRALVEKLVGLPKTGPIALAALAQSSEKRAADLFWRELSRREANGRKTFLLEWVTALSAAELSAVSRYIARRDANRLRWLSGELARCEDPRCGPLWTAVERRLGPEPLVIEAAGRLRLRGTLAYLRRFAGCSDERGEAAIEALGRIQAPKAVSFLVNSWVGLGVQVPTPKRRELFARALENLGDYAVGILRANALEGPRHSVAIEALIEIFPRRAGGVLVECLGRAPHRLRQRILGALARLRDPQVVKDLVPYLNDPRNRSWTRRALREIAGVDLGSKPSPWLEWWKRRQTKRSESSWLEASHNLEKEAT